ncbi:MAG: response regulator transcription factor [Sphingobacteriales bacterium]|nr:response regulator transcription factor [Sphingobacteriales bacterium]OJY83527.1 MAG: DNA-binding response regulator [Sphingobacteriales bacterium 44-15]
MQLRCVAIDDEPLSLLLIKEWISKFPELKLIETFEDAISGAEFIRHTPVDLLFIDIQMPDITGLDIVRSLEERPMVIFTTAHKKFALEGFELDAIDYLLKPIALERFTKAVTKAIEYDAFKKSRNETPPENLFVYSEYRLIRIGIDDIIFIESLQDYIKIHLADKKEIMTLMPLKKVLEKLPGTRFKRIHRSYVVAVNKVASVISRKVQLVNGTELPLSNSYLDFLETWRNP